MVSCWLKYHENEAVSIALIHCKNTSTTLPCLLLRNYYHMHYPQDIKGKNLAGGFVYDSPICYLSNISPHIIYCMSGLLTFFLSSQPTLIARIFIHLVKTRETEKH